MKCMQITVLELIEKVIRMNGGIRFIFCGGGLRRLESSL